MSISDNLSGLKHEIPADVKLIAVTKTQPSEIILEVYHSGHKIFGENKVQELTGKYQQLPKDIEWHLIGHLQSNKVKHIAPFISLIHSVDSFKLLVEINGQALKNNRLINCLLQIHIAQEETKFGLSFEEAELLLNSGELKLLNNVRIAGLMGMATLTEDKEQIRNEFKSLHHFFIKLQVSNSKFEILSMGMSSDYKIAIEEGSNLIRVGSAIFGERNYTR